MEDIHLHGRNSVDGTFHLIEWNEVPRHIQRQPAPRKARLIVNRHIGHGEARHRRGTAARIRILPYQLQKSLDPAQRPQRLIRRNANAPGSRLQ